jgi:hypothetical protein
MIFTNDSKSTFFEDEELEELSKFIGKNIFTNQPIAMWKRKNKRLCNWYIRSWKN